MFHHGLDIFNLKKLATLSTTAVFFSAFLMSCNVSRETRVMSPLK